MLKRLGAFFLDVLEVVVFAVGIFFFVYLLIMRPHKIKGQSMDPTFPDKEYLLTEKVSYYIHEPQRGDVVVFQPPPPNSDQDEFIKRIIGLPGEKVMVKVGKVYINGNQLKEAYLADTVYTGTEGYMAEAQEFTVPAGQYFVMGDNRPHSSDSRSWGPVAKAKISGRAWIVYWPPKGVVPKVSY